MSIKSSKSRRRSRALASTIRSLSRTTARLLRGMEGSPPPNFLDWRRCQHCVCPISNAGWDREMLAIELQGLVDLDFEIELTGFSLAEVDIVLDEARESATDGADASVEDTIPPYRHEAPTVSLISGLGSARRRI